jgi:NAD(P)-dependent dehydrogenase (short-subunit alcohol dehydrogenase family)
MPREGQPRFPQIPNEASLRLLAGDMLEDAAILRSLEKVEREDEDEIEALEAVESGTVADHERVGYRFASAPNHAPAWVGFASGSDASATCRDSKRRGVPVVKASTHGFWRRRRYMEMTPISQQESKVALVTGASSGMGAEIAVTLTQAGYAVASVGRDAERLNATVEAATGDGGQCVGIRAELTDPGAAEVVVDSVIERFGRLDALVNAAGIAEPSPFETSLETFDREWAVNVRAPYELTAKALPHLRRTRGSILFISSVVGKVGAAGGYAGYCTSKGAIENLVRALAVEEAPHWVRVNALAPGEIRTGMTVDNLKSPDYEAAILAVTPLQRIGEVSDIAPAAAFLLSDAAQYITGVSLSIDGGWVAQ